MRVCLRSVFLSALLALLVTPLSAQQGNPFIDRYLPAAYASDDYNYSAQTWGVVQHASGLLLTANTSGILSFDGTQWQPVQGTENKRMFKFATNASGQVFTGGIDELGYIGADSLGNLVFRSLAHLLPDSITANGIGQIFSVAAHHERVCFQSRKHIYEWSGSNFSVHSTGKRYYKVLETNVGIFADANPEGLCLLGSTEFNPVTDDHWLMRQTIKAVWPSSGSQSQFLVATMRGGLCQVVNGNVQRIASALDSLVIYNATVLNDNRWAISTNGNGVYIVNSQGAIEKVIDESTGLTHNQVPVPYVDHHGGLWACTYAGFSRVEYPAPLSTFEIAGTGFPLCAVQWQNQLLVGTTSGCFELHQSGKLVKASFASQRQELDYIAAFHARANELLISTQNGLFSLSAEGQLEIIAPYLDAIVTPVAANIDALFVGNRNSVALLKKQGNDWVDAGIIAELPHYVAYMATDYDGSLWVSNEKISRLDFDTNLSSPQITTLDSSNGFRPEMGICEATQIGNSTVFATEIGMYRFDEATQQLLPDTRVGENYTSGNSYVSDVSIAQDGRIWMSNRDGVGYIDPTDPELEFHAYPYTRAPISDVHDIFHHPNGTVWVLATEGIIAYDQHVEKNYQAPFKALLRTVHTHNDSLLFAGAASDSTGHLSASNLFRNPHSLPFASNYIKFSYAAGYYEAINELQYSHWLEGQETEWSKWNKLTGNEYTNLREGSYVFKVKARNVYGTESAVAEYRFSILPPWYRTWWAYILYAIGSFLGLWLLLYLNTRRLLRAKEHLEQTVVERTAEVVAQKDEIAGQKEEIEGLLDAKHEALLRAEASEKSKELFLANMSHEIRTPLNAVIGFTEIMRNEEHTERQESFLETIQSAGENLLVIINDILDFSKIEAGKLDMESVPFSLHKALEACEAMLRPKAEERALRFVLKADANIPPVLTGDPVRISQILINLVNNAVKFTEEGTVTVAAKLLNTNDNTANIELSVSDTGIGIAPEQVSAIFESFQQAATDTARKYGGTGLGTTIVKRLVELQNGSISVESELGAGTTFTVQLAFPISTVPLAEVYGSAGETGPFEPEPLAGNILVADDNKINQRLAHEVLTSFGLQADYADNGLHVIELLQKGDYDLILMDLQMPEMDGIEATIHIRKELPAPYRAIPIVAMTAHSLVAHVERCKAAGMQDHVSKPFKQRELYTVLENYVLKAPKQAVPEPAQQVANPSPEAQSISEAGLDFSYLKTITRNNTASILEMLELVQESTTKALEAIAAHRIAEDWDAIRGQLHKTASTLPMLGNERLQRLFLDGEQACETPEQLVAVLDEIDQLWAGLLPEINAAIVQFQSAGE